MSLETLTLATLAVWRVTHLLVAEDGPWNAVRHLRRAAGNGFWGQGLDCFYCLSLWVAAPFAPLLGTGWREGVLLWLGLSGGAILLERLTARPQRAEYQEDSDGLLWRPQTADRSDPHRAEK